MEDWSENPSRNRLMEMAHTLSETVKSETILEGSSQLSGVAYELAKSVCEAAGVGTDPRFLEQWYRAEFVKEQVYRLKEILSAIPSAFHHFSLTTIDGETVSPFDLGPREFLNVISTIKDLPADKLKRAYGTIWTHVRAMSEIQTGQISKAHQDLCLHAEKGHLEYVAQLYLKEADFVSPTLEWTLVDALIHARIIEFGNSYKFFGLLKDTAYGQLIEGPLLPGTKGEPIGVKKPSVVGIIGRGVSKFAVRGIGEALALLATWWIVSLVAGEEGVAKWILFTGATAARWIVSVQNGKNHRDRESERDETILQMLWDMGLTHERVPGMNVGLLRHLLYQLEERGAAFSHEVLNILDKRAKREALL